MPAASMISGSATASGMTTSAGPFGRRRGSGRGKARFGTAAWYVTGPDGRTIRRTYGGGRTRTCRCIADRTDLAESARDRGVRAGRRDLGRDRGLQRAVRAVVGHRPGRLLLLVPDPRRSVRPLGLDRSDRVRVLAGVPAAARADPAAALAGVHRGLDADPARRRVHPHRPTVVRGGRGARAHGARWRQHPPVARGRDRARVPLARDLGAGPADQDHAGYRSACGSSCVGSGGSWRSRSGRPRRWSRSRSRCCRTRGSNGRRC